ncbi:DUF397 domain-containing protein [Streptomyces sp. NPDC052095]|uniref:DUF397 domain-containing protein n=1 Tax=unclassified Streptomyces TaxID=2593676 RepID=UPI00344F11FB
MSVYHFRKSKYSSGDGECVEVACNVPGAVAIRDSKWYDGPVIVLASVSWEAFCDGLGRESA